MQEQQACAELADILNTVTQLFYFAKEQGTKARGNLGREVPQADADETERTILAELLGLGRKLMSTYFAGIGNGDLGYRSNFGGIEHRRQHCDRLKTYVTVFGEVSFPQCIYFGGDGSSARPVEAMANLPEGDCSYLMQDLLSNLALDSSYEEAKDFYQKFFGRSLSPTTIQESVVATAMHDESYQQQKPPPAREDEACIGVVSFDGKGVPMRVEDRTTGKKREALLGAAYTVAPQVRSGTDLGLALVMPELLDETRSQALRPPDRTRNTRYSVSLVAPKEDIFADVQRTVADRFASANTTATVCLCDGATVLWRLAETYFPDAVKILDLFHVSEYLWDAAKALEPDVSKQRSLVCAMLIGILNGKVGKVIGSLKIRRTKNKLRGTRREAVEKAITYFENHRDYMHYDKYLAEGYPVATGVIESACGHIVKNRMERAGAQWSLAGAEALLKLRAARANSDWEVYQQNRKQQERNRLYSQLFDNAA